MKGQRENMTVRRLVMYVFASILTLIFAATVCTWWLIQNLTHWEGSDLSGVGQ